MLFLESPTQHAQQRLAVVDDHGIMRGVFLTIVEDSPDYVVAWAAGSLAEARECIRRDPPDFLLLDVSLPDGNGFDFATELLQIAPNLPVLIVSALDDPSYRHRARKSGAKGFISKSTSLTPLVEVVNSILEGNEWFAMTSKMDARSPISA
jgi:DNA-binding NarL/FixJ family response regulator